MALLPGQYSITLEGCPESKIPLVTKESPRQISVSPSIVSYFLGVLPWFFLMSLLWGKTGELDHWELDYDGEVGKGLQHQQLNLGRPRSYLQHPNSTLNQWLLLSAKPRQWCSLIREFVRTRVCLIWNLKQRALHSLDFDQPPSVGRR